MILKEIIEPYQKAYLNSLPLGVYGGNSGFRSGSFSCLCLAEELGFVDAVRQLSDAMDEDNYEQQESICEYILDRINAMFNQLGSNNMFAWDCGELFLTKDQMEE